MKQKIFHGQMLFLLFFISLPFEAMGGCYALVKITPELKYAEDYQYPMTMQWNIVDAVEKVMLAKGDIKSPRKTKRHKLPAKKIKLVQKKLGLSETGCLDRAFIEQYLN